MTTWTLRQIDQVECLYSVRRVSHQATLDSAGLAAELAGAAASEDLVAAAHTFGVELHPGDLTVQANDRAERALTEITVRWRPTTRELALVGGPLDGAVYAFDKVPDPITVLLPPASVPRLYTEDPEGPALSRMNYYLAGWHETDRRWVYAP